MSVIAYRDGILAGDSRAWGGAREASPGQKAKLHELEDGRRVGVVSGRIGEPERFLAWLKSIDGPDEVKGRAEWDFRALMIDRDGNAFLFDDSLWPSGPIDCEFYAIGSGSEFAMGAMAMGASAARAVEVAIGLDACCGGPVRVIGPPNAD